MTFTSKVALVTGAASGMGAACARELAARGAHVIVVDRDAAGATQIAQEIGAPPPAVGDVSDSSFCEQAVDAALEHFARLDMLFNVAGIIVRADALATTDAQWQQMLAVNVGGVFFMSRSALRHMKQRRSGAIVNFGSIWGDVGAAGVLAYCASKGAVHQLTRAMALDHAEDGIRINAVCPGEVDTPMLRTGRAVPPTPEDLRRLADATIPMKRLADPVEIARVAVFLASDDASYMTGSLVTVDAGYTAR